MPPLSLRPANGGRLITRLDSSAAGLENYVSKRGFRRSSQTDEKLREGWDYFTANVGDDVQLHPFPSGTTDDIELVHFVRRPNGDAAIIAGTKTTLYRFNGNLLGYIEAGYVDGVGDVPYFEVPTRWQVIGSGFSSTGRRWEVQDIAGTTVLNNSKDIPVAYRVEQRFVEPLYELREQGILSVGTIGRSNDVLLCGDLTELYESDIEAVLGVVRSGAVKVSQAGRKVSGAIYATSTGTTVTASAAIFAAGDVDRVIVWSNGKRSTITAFTSSTVVTVAASDAVTVGLSFWVTDSFGGAAWDAFKLEATGAFFTEAMEGELIGFEGGQVRRIVEVVSGTVARTDYDGGIPASEGYVDNPNAYKRADTLGLKATVRRQDRVTWSEVGKPTRFAAAFPGVAIAASVRVSMSRTAKSIRQFDVIAVVGGGVDGGVAKSQLSGVGPGMLTLSESVSTAGVVSVQQFSSIGSIVGYDDLTDDGSGILKILELGSNVIVYKDTDLFIGRFTGAVEKPFDFKRKNIPHGWSLYYRNTLISIKDSTHIYAGRDRFYQFNLTSATPEPIPDADLLSNLFFDSARIEDTEKIYAADNRNTGEVWIVCPAATVDKTICYDYIYGTFSTIDFAPTCAASIKEVGAPLVQETSDWFLMGTADGTILQYGVATRPMAHWVEVNTGWRSDGREIFFRRDANPYNATKLPCIGMIKAGLGAFTDVYNEKSVNNYALQFSSRQEVSPSVTVSFYCAENPSGPETLLGSAQINDADYHGRVPLHAVSHYFSDEISATSTAPVLISIRTWNFAIVRSGAHGKF